jgi:hypothetical protein
MKVLRHPEYLDAIGEENLFPVKTRPIDSIYPTLDSEICHITDPPIFPQCHVALPDGEPRDEADAEAKADEAARHPPCDAASDDLGQQREPHQAASDDRQLGCALASAHRSPTRRQPNSRMSRHSGALGWSPLPENRPESTGSCRRSEKIKRIVPQSKTSN